METVGEMKRQEFIENQGATCKNWRWSWSFVNREAKFVIFGLWEDNEEVDGGLILSPDWAISEAGRKRPSFRECREHIDLVTEADFALLVFKQFARTGPDGKISRGGPRSIERFEPILERRFLFEQSNGWYAAPAPVPPSTTFEPLIGRVFEEGELISALSKRVERNPAAREACLEAHGYTCKVCGVSMKNRYGPAGTHVIEVHHLEELRLADGKRKVDPVQDLVPLCPNCHTIIHRRRPAYKLDEVREMLHAHV